LSIEKKPPKSSVCGLLYYTLIRFFTPLYKQFQ
jgi:hypothetical protein